MEPTNGPSEILLKPLSTNIAQNAFKIIFCSHKIPKRGERIKWGTLEYQRFALHTCNIQAWIQQCPIKSNTSEPSWEQGFEVHSLRNLRLALLQSKITMVVADWLGDMKALWCLIYSDIVKSPLHGNSHQLHSNTHWSHWDDAGIHYLHTPTSVHSPDLLYQTCLCTEDQMNIEKPGHGQQLIVCIGHLNWRAPEASSSSLPSCSFQ